MNGAGHSRADRRADTQERILIEARTIFAQGGYERATIRAIASAARVDPKLVMHYFGSKEELFSAVMRESHSDQATSGASPATVAAESLALKLKGMPETSIATMRSMLTHPGAADQARSALTEQIDSWSGTIMGDGAELRAALLISINLGITMTRELLELPTLRDADPTEIIALLGPAFEVLAGEAAEPGA